MTTRSIKQIINATAVSEGAGVTVYRTIGTPALKNLDPFLMLDFFSSDDPDDYIAGFPDHPHRGFNTFTYMLDGHMLHQDSMGNKGHLTSGGAQWMKAASGVIHSEMPQQDNGLMRGFQLWVNLPATEKMSAPGYQDYTASAMPLVEDDSGMKVKVVSGIYKNQQGPVQDPNTNVQYFEVSLRNGNVFTAPLNKAMAGFIYVFEGSVKVQDAELPQHTFAVLSDGDQLEVTGTSDDTRLIVVAGKPIGEPIVQYGPFVMNTEDEIHQAFNDFKDGTLVRDKASMVTA